MATKKEVKEQKPEKAEVKKPSIKTKEFKLKLDYEGKKAGVDSIKVGPKGEAILKSKKII